MKCDRCGREISGEDSFLHQGETLCEDCYLDSRFQVKTCDPWAVYSASRLRAEEGKTGVEGLTEQQKSIYAFVEKKGKATREEIIAALGIAEQELSSHLTVLRHCELLKGRREEDGVFVVPFNYGDK